jgi:hypothetical protein
VLFNAFFERSESVAPPPIVDGNDLMDALNLAPGPLVGSLLEAIREAQAAGEIRSRAAALALAEKTLRENQSKNLSTSGIDCES